MLPTLYLDDDDLVPALDISIRCDGCKSWQRLPADRRRGVCAQHGGVQTANDGPSRCEVLTPEDAWCVFCEFSDEGLGAARQDYMDATDGVHSDEIMAAMRRVYDPYAGHIGPGDTVDETHGWRK